MIAVGHRNKKKNGNRYTNERERKGLTTAVLNLLPKSYSWNRAMNAGVEERGRTEEEREVFFFVLF